jgi:hypothetical protein
MRKFFYFLVFFSSLFSNKLFPLDVVVKNDNNVPKTSCYVERYFWEESKILKPDGPCILKKSRFTLLEIIRTEIPFT